MLSKSFLKNFAVAALLGLALASCDRMITPRSAQIIKDAEGKTADGNYLRAIALYERALDDSPRAAEVHYRLALLYDDKMHDPLHALHHLKRYLTLAPSGPHANDVKNSMKKAELELGTTLSGDAVVSRSEAARLRNENLALRKEVDEQRARHSTDKTQPETKPADKKPGTAPRTYVVRDGDTLASISRKFYKSSGRWKKIRDANKNVITDPAKLKPGTTLTIP
ncbi:MAG TPA: LysM peptidoglycan-binding domain-containing protein [Chthoniobacterales bacterium]